MTPERELEFWRFLDALAIQLRRTRDVPKALSVALRQCRAFFAARRALLAVLRPGAEEAEVHLALPARGDWDLALAAAFIRNEHPVVPDALVMTTLRRRGRPWGVLVLERPEGFEPGTFRALGRAAAVISGALEQIDRQRLLDVRDRIDRNIMEQLRPKDLFYEILAGLRSLTRYDHSSALLIRNDTGPALTLVAEQIAWTKGKSRRIGVEVTLDERQWPALEPGEVYGFDRREDAWSEWRGRPLEWLAERLDYNRGGEPGSPREGTMLVAPVSDRSGVFGLLKVAALHPGSLTAYDAELVERFHSQASIAILNLHRTESLRARMLEAEKKNAMADLARGVSHDINNALGAVIPLVQEMRRDVDAGRIEPRVFAADLEQIQTSLQVCTRIFGGMLSLARGAARRTRQASLRAAVEGTLAILRDGLDRLGIDLVLEIPERLPPVAGGQSDLDQVLLNLVTNARDAMPRGGRLTIAAREDPGSLLVSVTDTGHGITAEDLPRVQEPFFTTKPEGTGLGLSICRSIIWEMDGKISIESQPGLGTRVSFVLPTVAAAAGGEV